MSLPETQVMKVRAAFGKLHKAQMVMGVVADEDVDWGSVHGGTITTPTVPICSHYNPVGGNTTIET